MSLPRLPIPTCRRTLRDFITEPVRLSTVRRQVPEPGTDVNTPDRAHGSLTGGRDMFQSKKRKALEGVIRQIKVDLANNYKDNAVENLKRLKQETEAATAAGELKAKEITELQTIIEHYETDMANFKRTY